MRIQSLHRKGDNTAYVIGTGPSLRCFDLTYFDDKFTIGINQAWKHLPTNYSLTVHPELVLEWEKTKNRHVTTWVIKRKPPMEKLTFDHPMYYAFDTSYDPDTVWKQPRDTLYLGEGAQTTAIDLAVRMGAKHVVLVGCDMTSLNGDFHAHDQHVKFLGIDPKDQFFAYRDTTAGVRKRLKSVLNVQVMTLTPFVGVGHAEEDYARLVQERGLVALPKPKDESAYVRDPSTIRKG